MWNGLIINRHTLFETHHQLFLKKGFVVKSCFLYTKLDCCNDWIKADYVTKRLYLSLSLNSFFNFFTIKSFIYIFQTENYRDNICTIFMVGISVVNCVHYCLLYSWTNNSPWHNNASCMVSDDIYRVIQVISWKYKYGATKYNYVTQGHEKLQNWSFLQK